jgi:hypothetical protein
LKIIWHIHVNDHPVNILCTQSVLPMSLQNEPTSHQWRCKQEGSSVFIYNTCYKSHAHHSLYIIIRSSLVSRVDAKWKLWWQMQSLTIPIGTTWCSMIPSSNDKGKWLVPPLLLNNVPWSYSFVDDWVGTTMTPNHFFSS